jgi:tryptophan halogenase
MSIPDSLAFKMELFRKHGHVSIEVGEDFGARPWLTMMYNQGIVPESYPPLTDEFDDHTMLAEMAKVRSRNKRPVDQMPRHEEFIARHCSAMQAAV